MARRSAGPVIEWDVTSSAPIVADIIPSDFIAMIGEFVGTVLFLIFALGGTNVANIPSTSVTGGTTAGQSGSTAATANTSNLSVYSPPSSSESGPVVDLHFRLFIALSFGFSLAVNAWIFFRVSGGLFNPAVSAKQSSKCAGLGWSRSKECGSQDP